MPWYYFEFVSDETNKLESGYIHSTNLNKAAKVVKLVSGTAEFSLQLHHFSKEDWDEEE